MKKTASFITEIPIKTTSYEEAVLRKRFWAAKQQYNALLGECLKRLEAMRKDPRYKEAKLLYKSKETRKESKSLFRDLAKEYGYREYDLSSYCNPWNERDHLDKKEEPSLYRGSYISKISQKSIRSM